MAEAGKRRGWQTALGSELQQEFKQRHDVSDILPNSAGIYMWKHAFAPSPLDRSTGTRLLDWIRRIATQPYGQVQSMSLSHFARLSGLSLSGTGLPAQKQQVLEGFLASASNRQWTSAFLAQLADHSPSLYVGEAGDIAVRIGQHLSEETDFGHYVANDNSLNFNDLILYFWTMPPGEKYADVRRAFEYVTASATIAGYTKRPG